MTSSATTTPGGGFPVSEWFSLHGLKKLQRRRPEKAWGYQDDSMNLPECLRWPSHSTKPFSVSGHCRAATPRATLAVPVRDQIQIGLAENGGESTQDGCAF